MFKRQTLFILGAGASVEVGLPTGPVLTQQIRKKMDIRFERGHDPIGEGDMNLYRRLTQMMQKEVDEYQDAAWLIRNGISLAQSIDDFLDLHRTNKRVNLYGKAAIVQSILQAERQSRLHLDAWGDGTFHPEHLANTWFVKFMHMLARGIPIENVREIFDSVSFIVFNYDRCIEHFLSHALKNLYGIQDREAKEIVDGLRIIHPYGAVSNDVPFGNVEGADCVALASGIKTYTEQIDNAEITEKLGSELARADSIVFLGFAYHAQNMRILSPPEATPRKSVYGTAFGMSDSDVDVVSNQIANFFMPTMSVSQRAQLFKFENKLTCAGLFDNYAKSLTGGD